VWIETLLSMEDGVMHEGSKTTTANNLD
jgi:hypothetical protein